LTINPLHAKRVVNTRALHQAPDLDALLSARGAQPISYPCIDIAPPEDTALLDEALQAAAEGRFEWLVLTSENTVMALERRLPDLGIEPQKLSRARIAAVGPKTAESIGERLGLAVELVPEEHVAEALAESLAQTGGERGRVLLPQSQIAREVLANDLRAAGFEVSAPIAYRTVRGSGGADVPALLNEGAVDAVIFTSASTAHNFADRLAAEGGSLDSLAGVCLACIGPVTAAAVQNHGLTPTVVPTTYTLEGILDEMARYYAAHQQKDTV
jgi:uroporphyrinogen III methyltransferase/synthase